jgi:hypothetical protein
MTQPIVTETTAPPEPVVPDPFISDVTSAPVTALAIEPPKRRRIWD